MLWRLPFPRQARTILRAALGSGVSLPGLKTGGSRARLTAELFVGDLQPFFLTYQEESNLPLLKQYGQVCAKAMQTLARPQKSPAFKRPLGKRIRLGIVSGDIRLHSFGWL